MNQQTGKLSSKVSSFSYKLLSQVSVSTLGAVLIFGASPALAQTTCNLSGGSTVTHTCLAGGTDSLTITADGTTNITSPSNSNTVIGTANGGGIVFTSDPGAQFSVSGATNTDVNAVKLLENGGGNIDVTMNQVTIDHNKPLNAVIPSGSPSTGAVFAQVLGGSGNINMNISGDIKTTGTGVVGISAGIENNGSGNVDITFSGNLINHKQNDLFTRGIVVSTLGLGPSGGVGTSQGTGDATVRVLAGSLIKISENTPGYGLRGMAVSAHTYSGTAAVHNAGTVITYGSQTSNSGGGSAVYASSYGGGDVIIVNDGTSRIYWGGLKPCLQRLWMEAISILRIMGQLMLVMF